MLYFYRVEFREMNSNSICYDVVSIRSKSFDVAANVALEKIKERFCDTVTCNVYDVIEVTFIHEFEG